MAKSNAVGVTAGSAPAALRAESIRFAAAGRDILNGIDLVLDAGERVGVIGPNGSGKSTFLRCLFGWHVPRSGVVILDGTPLSEVDATERARCIAVLAQEPASGLGLTVGEVVALGRMPYQRRWSGRSPADTAAIAVALEATGLTTWADRSFGPLSGGEKQRVLFARALAQEPTLLILDEPTNHLDIRHQLELLQVASDLGVTVIVTLHDLNLAARWCDRLCLLVDGRIRAVGTPGAVLDPDIVGDAYGVAVDRDIEPRSGRPRLAFHLKSPPGEPSS